MVHLGAEDTAGGAGREAEGFPLFSFFFLKCGRRRGRGGLEGKRDKRGRGPLMRALVRIIMGLADRNQDLSQRSQLTPSPLP